MDSCAARGDLLQAQTDSPFSLIGCIFLHVVRGVESPQSFFILPRPPFSLVRLETISIVYCFKSVRTFALILTFLLDCLIDLQIWIFFFRTLDESVCVCVSCIHMERKKRPLRGAQCSQCRPLCRSIFCSSFTSLTHGTVCICFLVELPNCDSQRGFRMLLFDVLTLSLCYCLNISYRESRALAVSVLLDLFVSDLHMFVVAVVKPQLLVSLTADGNYTTRRADSESAQSICRLDSVPQIHSSVCMLRSVRVVTVVTELSFKDPPPFLWV